MNNLATAVKCGSHFSFKSWIFHILVLPGNRPCGRLAVSKAGEADLAAFCGLGPKMGARPLFLCLDGKI